MKFIDSGFEIISQEAGLDGLYKHVEKVARVSYKSEDKITEDSAKKMVSKLIDSQHLSCLEHGTIYLKRVFCIGDREYNEFFYKYNVNPFSVINVRYDVSNDWEESIVYVTTNARVIIENNWHDDLKYMCEPTEFHEKRYTVKFIWPIGIVRDALRHRKFAFMNESTRYINYTKERFGGLTIVIPRWIYQIRDKIVSYDTMKCSIPKEQLLGLSGEELVNQLTCESKKVAAWVDSLTYVEQSYFYLTSDCDDLKLRPEQARGVLPLDTKSELIMTGFVSDWVHFFNMRSYIAMTGPAHEDMRYIVNLVLYEFLERSYIKHEDLYKRDEMEDQNVKESS